MNITILDNRDVIINSSDNLGTQNENNASIINFSFPESLMNANKKIVFITDDGNYWDLITNNSYKITNAVSKYKNVSVYVWLVDEQNDIDFRSKIWNVSFNKNEEPDDIVPTEEEISGFDTMITQLNQGLEELDEEKIKLRREYEKVEEGLEDLDEALIQVNNVDIDVSKSQTTTTVTITNKEGTEKSVQIEDGTDYVITPEDYQTIANVVETDITPLIPTKTSDLDNDSGFIDNTVNNLTNYYDKTTSDGKYALITETGYRVELSVDSSTYVMTLNLKNKSGNILNTQTVDLPLETMVVNASYDSLTKEIVLTLQNGNTIRFSVADLVSGLQTEITSNNKLASDLVDDTNQTNKFVTTTEKTTWNSKYDKPSGGIPKTDLSSAVQTSLGKADTAVQDVSGKEDESNKVTSINENSTDTQYPSAKLLYDQLAEKQEQIDALVEENSTLKKQQLKGQATGTSIQLTDSAEGLEIENVVIKGAMGQVQYEGKNKLTYPYTQSTATSNGVTFTARADGSVLVNGTATGYASFKLYGDYQEANNKNFPGQYLSGGTSTVKLKAYNNTNNSYTELGADSGNGVQINTTVYTKGYIELGVYPGTTVNNEIIYPMVLNSLSDRTYEPFCGGEASPNLNYPQEIHCVTGTNIVKVQNSDVSLQQTAPLTLGNIKLYDGDKITIAYVEQAGYKKVTGASIVRKWKEYIVTGNETVTLQNSGIRIYMAASANNFAKPLRATEHKLYGLYCSHLVEKTPYQTWIGLQGISYDLNLNTGFEGFDISINDFSTVQEYLNWFKNKYDAGTPFYIVYQLAEPETVPITDPTLLSQLETLINMKTYKQITNIDTTGSDLAPVLEFQYSKDLQTVTDTLLNVKVDKSSFVYDSNTETLTITIS